MAVDSRIMGPSGRKGVLLQGATLASRLLTLLSLTLALTLAAPVSAQIVRYSFTGGSFAPDATGTNVTATAVNTTGSQATITPGAVLPDSLFFEQNLTGPAATDAAAAVAQNRFFQFSVTPTDGRRISFTSLTFDAARGGASTPRGWVLRSSVDGFASDIATSTIATARPNLSSFNVALNSSTFRQLDTTTFRVYGYSPDASAGIFFDNLQVNGTVEDPLLLAEYLFTGGAFTPTSQGRNVTATAVNTTGSQATITPGAVLPDSLFFEQNLTGPAATDAAAAVAQNRYFEFSAAADDGFAFNLSRLTFDAARGGASTPRGWVLRSSVDGFASDIATSTIATARPNLSSFDVSLGGTAYQNLRGTTFRVYGYSPDAGAGIFFDNIRLYGTTSVAVAAPEPSTLALLAGAAVTALPLVRPRRRRRCRA